MTYVRVEEENRHNETEFQGNLWNIRGKIILGG